MDMLPNGEDPNPSETPKNFHMNKSIADSIK